MTRVWQLLALGVGVYLLILITSFPAAQVTARIQDQVADLSINGVSGSVLSGQAAQLVYQGLDLGPLHWRFRPLSLLLGRVEYHLELSGPDNTGQLDVGKTLTGRTYIQDMDIALLPDRLINHYSPVAIHTSGSLRLVFDELSPDEDYSGTISGQLQWQDAAVLEPINVIPGSLVLDVTTRDGLLVGSFDNSGNLDVSGEVTLSAINEYRVDLTLHPVADINNDTLDLLEENAVRQPDGSYRIDKSGQF